MPKFTGIESIRAVEWGQTYLWEFRILGVDKPTAPFDDWFPAQDIELPEATLETYSWEAFLSSYKIPLKSNVHDMTIIFPDDVNHTLRKYFKAWMNDTILNGGEYISTLETSVRQVLVNHYNAAGTIIHSGTYYVFPEGTLSFKGTNDTGLPTYSVTLTVAGKSGNS